jgi:hypothetical protein
LGSGRFSHHLLSKIVLNIVVRIGGCRRFVFEIAADHLRVDDQLPSARLGRLVGRLGDSLELLFVVVRLDLPALNFL